MRRGAIAAIVVLGCGLTGVPAQAHRGVRAKAPSGVKGVVLDATCAGACRVPAPPEPVYTGAVTVVVTNAATRRVVASEAISDGHFRLRVRPGSYDVASVPEAQGAAIAAPCETGETQQVVVRRHRFTPVTLHVRNSCIV
jgi:hypothetical protein